MTDKAFVVDTDRTRTYTRSSAPVRLAVFLCLKKGEVLPFYGRVERRNRIPERGIGPEFSYKTLVDTRLPKITRKLPLTKTYTEASMPNSASLSAINLIEEIQIKLLCIKSLTNAMSSTPPSDSDDLSNIFLLLANQLDVLEKDVYAAKLAAAGGR